MARPRLVTDEQILSTTRDCVLAEGPTVAIDTIAAQLGVTGPALLKRFGSREELMLAALRPPTSLPFEADFLAGPDERPLEEQLEAMLGTLYDFLAVAVPCVTALRESGIPHEKLWGKGQTPPARLLQVIGRWVSLGVERGVLESPTPDTVATAMLGAVQTRVFTAHVLKLEHSSRSNREYVRELAALFTRALALPSSARRPKRAS